MNQSKNQKLLKDYPELMTKEEIQEVFRFTNLRAVNNFIKHSGIEPVRLSRKQHRFRKSDFLQLIDHQKN